MHYGHEASLAGKFADDDGTVGTDFAKVASRDGEKLRVNAVLPQLGQLLQRHVSPDGQLFDLAVESGEAIVVLG
ncbi:MAG: hypothetical protein QGG09_00265 [Pirellulaceae bacterium]|nr:hypothetical protein [Pirellulaceae bacterium]